MKLPKKIAVLGMGYVGTPLAIEFSKHFSVVGFDINRKRIEELRAGIDSSNELEPSELIQSDLLNYSHDEKDLSSVDCFIVTVPTPVDSNNKPDFNLLVKASELVGKHLKKGGIVIYESTVFPGATEEICVPALENSSGLIFNTDFFCGYSPERINPGDKNHKLVSIKKVVSGSTQEVASVIEELYLKIIEAGTHKTSSIKVAEAAKVIENSQRDINIAFINELSKIFTLLDIDTFEVLEAAETKWNFLPFRPGLVGGHCIGVDPYYLSSKAESLGYNPEIILSGRRINESMSEFVFSEVIGLMINNKIEINSSTRVLILGLTFKENCSDTRNSKVFDLVKSFIKKGLNVDVFDPHIDTKEIESAFDIKCLSNMPQEKLYSAIILAVGHDDFKAEASTLSKVLIDGGVIFDIKGVLPKEIIDGRL
tara:strand:+ start:33697 stop:34971 length:1275 start_codon:yes stop_codon:yes gene_type:complete